MADNRVPCDIFECDLTAQSGRVVRGITVKCERCGYFTQCFGTKEPSRKRGLALLREGCPENEENYYYEDED